MNHAFTNYCNRRDVSEKVWSGISGNALIYDAFPETTLEVSLEE